MNGSLQRGSWRSGRGPERSLANWGAGQSEKVSASIQRRAQTAPDLAIDVAPDRIREPARFDFRTGLGDASLFPQAAWRRSVTRALRSSTTTAGIYEFPAGRRDLRAAIARHIGISRSVVASADDVVITNGTQQALDLLARVLLAPGDAIAVEDPGYGPRESCSRLWAFAWSAYRWIAKG